MSSPDPFTTDPTRSIRGVRNCVLLSLALYALCIGTIVTLMAGSLNYAVERSLVAKFEAQETDFGVSYRGNASRVSLASAEAR